MNKAFLSIAMLVISGTFTTGCLNRATFDSKDGGYHVNGRSTSPEAMAATLSQNRQGELRMEAYKNAVDRGMMFPYGGVGPVGDYRNFYCQNGSCMSPQMPPVMMAPQAPPATTPPATPNKPSAEKPVTREELEAVKATAADAQKKANTSVGILKVIRTERKEGAVTPPSPTTTAPQAPPPAATPVQKPVSQQELDDVNRRAEEARKRAEAASAAPTK